jgi:predicted kinase
MNIKDIICEGIHDPAIFKAVFLVGGAGSGKTFVSQQLGLRAMGFVNINTDDAFEYLMTKQGLNFKMPPEEEPEREVARSRAKEITSTKQNLALDGRLGIIIDGTGDDYDKISTIRTKLKQIGYETFLIVVNTDLEVALARNKARPRSVPEHIAAETWYGAQKNIGRFLNLFSNNAVVDNNDKNSPLFHEQIQKTHKRISSWAKRPPKTQLAKEWLSHHGNS